jgi:hypothetical protein
MSSTHRFHAESTFVRVIGRGARSRSDAVRRWTGDRQGAWHLRASRRGRRPECVGDTDVPSTAAAYGRNMDVPAPVGSYLTPSFRHARVRDAMRPWVLTCDASTALVTAAQQMARRSRWNATVMC